MAEITVPVLKYDFDTSLSPDVLISMLSDIKRDFGAEHGVTPVQVQTETHILFAFIPDYYMQGSNEDIMDIPDIENGLYFIAQRSDELGDEESKEHTYDIGHGFRPMLMKLV